jgi:hypothetical protein
MDFVAFLAAAILGFAVGCGVGTAAAYATFGAHLLASRKLTKAVEVLVKQIDARRAMLDDDLRTTGPGPVYFRTDPDRKQ